MWRLRAKIRDLLNYGFSQTDMKATSLKHYYRQTILTLLVFFGFQIQVHGQGIEKAFPTTIKSPTDSFSVKFSNSRNKYSFKIGESDTVDMGTDGAPGMFAVIYYGKDSLKIPYSNPPYFNISYIPIQSTAGKSIYRLHFNSSSGMFPASYIKKNKGKIQVEIPEVYELANIIWTFSPSGKRSTDLINSGSYYEKVLTWFKPYLDHPLFKQLDFPDSLYFHNYYDFRENSFAFSFKGDKLVSVGPYYYVTGNDWGNYNSLFKQLLPVVEDFAKKSGFREFYKSNTDLYAKQVKREKELMPVKSMWEWMEIQFPKKKFQSYKVVFSPLIGGSHSTQNYATYANDEYFRETVMFVCGTERYDKRTDLSEKQKEGLMSGIVFTEIDHNYVNPVSYQYAKVIDSAFSERTKWAGANTKMYGNQLLVFNEYMTHAVFCLWVMDQYDKPTADFVIKSRESLMVDKRHFIKFKEFNQELIRLRFENKDKKVSELYPQILKWCKINEP